MSQLQDQVAGSSEVNAGTGAGDDVSALVARALALGAAVPVDPGAAAELVSLAGGRREPLEAARKVLVGRLEVSASDVEASLALRLVSAALHQVGFIFQTFKAGPTGRKLLPKPLRSH